jgi:hypothetical protein
VGEKLISIVWETWDYVSKAGMSLADGGGEIGKAKEIFLEAIFSVNAVGGTYKWLANTQQSWANFCEHLRTKFLHC